MFKLLVSLALAGRTMVGTSHSESHMIYDGQDSYYQSCAHVCVISSIATVVFAKFAEIGPRIDNGVYATLDIASTLAIPCWVACCVYGDYRYGSGK